MNILVSLAVVLTGVCSPVTSEAPSANDVSVASAYAQNVANPEVVVLPQSCFSNGEIGGLANGKVYLAEGWKQRGGLRDLIFAYVYHRQDPTGENTDQCEAGYVANKWADENGFNSLGLSIKCIPFMIQ